MRCIPVIVALSLISCSQNLTRNDEVVAQLGGKELLLEEIEDQLPKAGTLAEADSIALVQTIARNWAKNELLVEAAEFNLKADLRDFEDLVRQYRNDLLKHAYIERYVSVPDLRANQTLKKQERLMKKVLLTTTALVMTAGVAAAEVSFSGVTQASISATGASGENTLNTHIDLNMAVSSTADNGMTMAATVGYDEGRQVDAGDFELDAEESGWASSGPELSIGYAGYTITAQDGGIADLYNGDKDSGDLGISGSLGDVAFAVTTNVGGVDSASYKLSYTIDALTATLTGSDTADGVAGVDATKLALSYVMGNTTFTASSDDKDGVETVTSLGVTTKMSDAITLSYTAKNTETDNSNVGDDWDASIAYSAGALTASFALDEDDITKLSGTYDLGGGTSLFAVMRSGKEGGVTDKDFQAVGLNFTF
jgi:outer membrane protein OmpU